MRSRNTLLLSALVYLASSLAAAVLARTPSTLAHVLAAVVSVCGILGTARLCPAGNFPRWALVGAGAIFAACLMLPLAFVADRAAWLRQLPVIVSYFWLWMMMLGLPAGRTRRWCHSPRLLLLAAAILGGGVVATSLW